MCWFSSSLFFGGRVLCHKTQTSNESNNLAEIPPPNNRPQNKTTRPHTRPPVHPRASPISRLLGLLLGLQPHLLLLRLLLHSLQLQLRLSLAARNSIWMCRHCGGEKTTKKKHQANWGGPKKCWRFGGCPLKPPNKWYPQIKTPRFCYPCDLEAVPTVPELFCTPLLIVLSLGQTGNQEENLPVSSPEAVRFPQPRRGGELGGLGGIDCKWWNLDF